MLVLLCFTLFTFGAVSTSQTFDPEPTCQENEHYAQESVSCQKTCLNYRLADSAGACKPFTGCECDDGFVRLFDDATGPCVLTSECDYLNCNGDPNATYKQCPWACQPTCDAPDAIPLCKRMCLRAGCECKPGYIRSENGGYCIRPGDCPGGDPCRGNQTFVACKVGCPTNYCPVDDRRAIVACSPPYPCPPGCICKSNHLRLSRNDMKCVLASECPPVNCTRPNEEWNPCTSNCLAERCSDIGNDRSNCRPYSYCRPQCVCKEGFYRNRSDICIPVEGCLCQENEQYVQNSTVCQKTCGNRLVSGGLESCEPFTGCTCTEGFVRPYDDATGACIPVSECAPIPTSCGVNEEPTSCKAVCPPQSCAISYTTYACEERQCEPGCNCIQNYLRNSSEICILNDNCPPPPPYNEHYVYNSSECQKTCGNRLVSGSPTLCNSFTGYVCDDGYVRTYDNATGPCILESDCEPIPTNCGLNEEASSCKVVCPPQSCNISYTSYDCENIQCEPGCNCIENHLRNASGVCILNDDCFPQQQNMTCNGDRNATYKECSMPCPPTCDSPNAMSKCTKVCSGFSCECQPGYILSASDGQCILPEDCPGGNPCGTNKTFAYCNAGCPNNYCPVYDSLAMVACSPPFPCPSGCSCNANYLIENSDNVDDDDKRCILSSDCSPVKCTRPNEVWNSCPGLCLAESCSDIGKPTECYQSYPYCGPKCVCKEGFYRNESNICVPAAECDGNPCGVNGTYSDCSFRCPNQYCPEDDSRVTILCKPGRPCPPGCMCKQDYLRISSQNDTCVLARDCPKIDCTRPNEIWDSCSSECLAEKCEDMYKPNPCSADDNPGCKPRCICKKGYFRDENDACVPNWECPNYIKTPPPSTATEPCIYQNNTGSDSSSWYTGYRKPRRPQCVRTCAEPKPKNCRGAIKNRCKDGYILSKRGGKCIKIEDCPQDIGCNGDKYAVVKACPLPCPVTCANPNYNFCKRMCDPVGCECKPGYLLSKENGKCILPNDCKGGNPCGSNGVFLPCKSGCPTDYCPVDDSRGRIICETYPFSPCYPGCGCKLNNKFMSPEDRTCILSYECPPVNCTRPFEEWSPCPSACLAESCEDVNNQPSACNTFVFNCDPKCICIKNHFRNQSDICVPAKKCPTVTVQ